MALLTEEDVRRMSNQGTRGPVVVNRDQMLTPGARDYLREHRVEVVYPQGEAAGEGAPSAPAKYRTLFGAALNEKPEHMTHLKGNVLVFKDHPRIAFRGWIDALEAEILLTQQAAAGEGYRALAGELKHSETAFVRRTGEGSFHIRYFTPAEEVDLCGHATIASFTVLRERRAIGPGTYALHTRSGDLSIQVGADAVWMDMAPPADGRSFSEEEQAELYAAYGLSLADRPEGLEAQAVSTGLLDILLPVRDLAALERAEQNEGEVTRLSERYGVVGVHMFCPSTPDAAAHCRNFAPLYAIPEEAATGTSNGALTYYLYRRGLTAAGAENRFVQGEKMGKPSEILSRLTDGGDGVKVQVGGRAVLALRCELL